MKAELKAQWVAALRSGQYKQGVGYLHNQGCYCCLGVLADTYNPKGWTPIDGWDNGYQFCGQSSVLEYYSLNEFGLSSEYQDILIGFNDDTKYTFEQIADWIEQNVAETTI